jgi:dTDP-4-dehydrorhamnose reductase
MKLLILGRKGMAGHVMAAYFIQKMYEEFYTSRVRNNQNSHYLQKVFGQHDVKIIPDYEEVLNRMINSKRTDFQYLVPFYEDMLVELRNWLQKE